MLSPPSNSSCPHLPEAPARMDFRVLRAHGHRRDADFYFDALRYGQFLWTHRIAGRAILAVTRALYADVPSDAPILARWPLPYPALGWIVAHHGSPDFPGNPRISFQHQASRLRGDRAALRQSRAWAAWAVVRAAKPELAGDPSVPVPEPSLETIASALEQHGHPGEAESWFSVVRAQATPPA